MSWATTRALVGTRLAAVCSSASVHNRIRTDLERENAEQDLVKEGGDGKIRCLEYTCTPGQVHGGASGYQRTTMKVQVVMTWFHDDGDDSYGELVDNARLAMEDLALPSVFPQLAPEGILTTDPGTIPLRLRTGHSALRLVFGFELIDVEAT